MFSLFKADPVKKLEKQYQVKMEEAMQMQRFGNIRRYSELTEEADTIRQSLEALKAKQS